ncbi:MAG TPA: S41 family peptidase [Planctomycetota bacterium]|nr:S41 family peptidase [Planctomycetota bacterium]
MDRRLVFLVVSPVAVFAAGIGFLAAEARARPKSPTIYWPTDVVEEMRVLVERDYVDEIDDARARGLFYAACKAYLNGLDPYCEFLTPEERREMDQETQGEFGGVGILQSRSGEGIRIRGARIGDPAWKAGIRAGDLIVSVDGVEATGESGAKALPRLRGKPDTAVTVAWMPRDGGPRREAPVVRSLVKIDSITGVQVLDRKAGIGYLRLVRFQDNTGPDLRAALKRLRADGARSFVVDLRSDYGGVLPAAVACADAFLGAGTQPIVVTKSRQGFERPGHMPHSDPDDDLTAPLVLLVDAHTASAAEVLAGALQDHRRAILVGERTYGKFLVQRIVPLPGEDVAVRLTTARYYTPQGRNLQRDDARNVRGGLVPEIPVIPPEDGVKALRAWWDDQVGLDWDLMPPGPDAPDAPDDPVLAKAVEILRDADALR